VEGCQFNIISLQDICVAEELVKQGYATWEKRPKEEQQRIVGNQSKQPQAAGSEDVSPGKKNDAVDGAGGQNSTASGDCRKTKSVAHDAGMPAPDGLWDACDSEGGLEMG
jgi:hypothetical protein